MSSKFKILIDYFTKLPGIGPRHATRLVLAILNWTDQQVQEFSNVISTLRKGALFCSECYNLSDADLCSLCTDPSRKRGRIAVVEKITDLVSMEKTGAFDGIYHVLGGAIDPTNGVLPEYLRIKELKNRISKYNESPEIILATSPTASGDTTALYIQEYLAPLNVKITRLARGLANGSTLEYADETTLAQALRERR